MADGHRGVGVQQQQRHGLADDVAAAEHHGPASRKGDAVVPEQLQYAAGRARDEARPLLDQQSHVRGMETVHVLSGVHRDSTRSASACAGNSWTRS
jgi:hypothetical protein